MVCLRRGPYVRFWNMTRLSWWSRVFTMLFALGQFALPSALSIGDAMSSADARTAFAHVEDASGGACQAAHAGDCAVCRYLSALNDAPSAQSFDVPRLKRGELTGLVRSPVISHRAHGFLSRAPPRSDA